MTQWYYTKMGIQQGPVSEAELRQKIRRGEIGESNLLWRDGMAEWLKLESIPELRDGGNVEVAATAVKTVETSPHLPGTIPLPQPAPISAEHLTQRIPNYLWQSIVALVVSCIGGLVICLPIGVPFAIVAIVYANKVDRLVAVGDHMGATLSSRNAKIWMIISFVFSGLVLLGFVALIFFAIAGSAFH